MLVLNLYDYSFIHNAPFNECNLAKEEKLTDFVDFYVSSNY